MKFKVSYSKSALEVFAAVFEWVADHSSPATTERFVMALYNFCEELKLFRSEATPATTRHPGGER